jgi:hypothetical protein
MGEFAQLSLRIKSRGRPDTEEGYNKQDSRQVIYRS